MPNDIVSDIIKKEGGFVNNPADAGGRTDKGISEKSNPAAWADGKVTEEEARAIYQRKYLEGPGFNKIKDKRLQSQLVDFGVTSGSYLVIQKLQSILGVPSDGILGPLTLSKLEVLGENDTRKINNLLVAERVKMIGRIVKKDPSQLEFINGWISRCFEFLL